MSHGSGREGRRRRKKEEKRRRATPSCVWVTLGDLEGLVFGFLFCALGGGTVERQGTQDLEKEFGTYQELYKALFSL